MMPSRPSDLPDFDYPPVTEVVLGVQFEALIKVRSYHAGKLHAKFPDLPVISEQQALAPLFEVFGVQPAITPTLQLLQEHPVPRYWFHSSDGAELVQFQPDRLLRNWIKKQPDQQYPRYEVLREQFVVDLAGLRAFLDEEELGAIKPNQCEITYVNTIEIPNEPQPWAHIEKILKTWSNEYRDDQGLEMEDATVTFRYALKESEEPYGRLHATVQPALRRADGQQVVQLNLTVRGRPANDTVDAALALLDNGRNVIVKAFGSMTRLEMQKHWRRQNA